MAALAGNRPRISHGMAGLAHPVCNVLAKSFDMAGIFSGFPVALPAIAFMIRLVCFVRKYNAILEFENLGAIICKCGCYDEKNCRN